MSIKLHEGYKPIHLQNTECNKHHSKECPIVWHLDKLSNGVVNKSKHEKKQ